MGEEDKVDLKGLICSITTPPTTDICIEWHVKLCQKSGSMSIIKPYPAKLIYLNFHPLEVASRYRDPQLQVGENYSYLFNLRTIICKS